MSDESSENGHILVTPEREHVCSPGWESRWHKGSTGDFGLPAGHYMHDLHCPAGTVWECSCGKVWVAVKMPDRIGSSVVIGRIRWRPEKRRERRRRLRSGVVFGRDAS